MTIKEFDEVFDLVSSQTELYNIEWEARVNGFEPDWEMLQDKYGIRTLEELTLKLNSIENRIKDIRAGCTA